MSGKRTVLLAALLFSTVFLSAYPAAADVVVLLDGRAIEGTITRQDRRSVTIKTKSGIVVTVDRDEIERIVTMEDLKKEYRERLSSIRKDDEFAHMELAEWCDKNGLKEEYKKELEEVLRINPKNTEAKKRLDLFRGELPEDMKKEVDAAKAAQKKAAEKKPEPKAPVTKPAPEEEPGVGKERPPAEKFPGEPEVTDKKIQGGGKGSPAKPSKAKKALKKALAYIASKQNDDGHWDCQMSGANGQVVVTSLCGLALMAGGSTLDSGPYALNVFRAVRFVSQNITKIEDWEKKTQNGTVNGQQNWRWGLGGMFLAEAYAKSKNPEIKTVLDEVVRLLAESQEPSGGWGHGPGGPNALGYVELEVVSNWALSAMGMAKSLGCKVKSFNFKKGMDYVLRCTNKAGGVAYSTRPGQRGHGCPGRTGGAMLAFTLCKNRPSNYSKMAAYLAKTMKQAPSGHASPVMHIMGSGLGAIQTSKEMWDQFAAQLIPVILQHTNPDGSFRTIVNPQEGDTDSANGPFYTGGICALMLAVDEGRLKYMSGRYARGSLGGSLGLSKKKTDGKADEKKEPQEKPEPEENKTEPGKTDEEEKKVKDSR
ncbi:MAG: DUF6288 domain-containing protein [Planctomycetota bacterium]|jgi:hypothetical protein